MTALSLEDINETLLGLVTPAVVLTPLPEDDFVLQSANASALKMLRPASNDPVGRTLNDIPFTTSAGQILQSIAGQVMQGGSSKVVETSIARVDGSRLDLSTTWVPIFTAGKITAIVLTVEDISELVAVRMQRAYELSLFASGFVKTCAWCGRVRDQERWRSASDYLADHPSEDGPVRCPDCR